MHLLSVLATNSTMTQSAQEAINLNLLNDQNINLKLVAKNSHLPWNPISLSLHSKLTQRFVDDHPELPWNRDILEVRFQSRIHFNSPIDNKPDVSLTKLATHSFSCGELFFTAKLYAIHGSQGVVLVRFDDEYYYLCQLDIDGKNPWIVPNKLTQFKLTQFKSFYADYLIEILVKDLVRQSWDTAWNSSNKRPLRSIVKDILEYYMTDLEPNERKKYILSELSSESEENLYLDMVRLLCTTNQNIGLWSTIKRVLNLIVRFDDSINSIDLCVIMLVVIDSDYSSIRKLSVIEELIELYDDDYDYLIQNLIESVKNELEDQNQPGDHTYRIIKVLIKTICPTIVEVGDY